MSSHIQKHWNMNASSYLVYFDPVYYSLFTVRHASYKVDPLKSIKSPRKPYPLSKSNYNNWSENKHARTFQVLDRDL